MRKKKILISLVSVIVFIGFLIIYIAITKIGLIIDHPYDKHLKGYTKNNTVLEEYHQDLEFIYTEIKNNYVNLTYKEELFGFDWDDRYEYYQDQIKDSTDRKEFYTICNEYIAELRDGHVWFGEYNISPEDRIWAPYSKGFVYALQIRLIEDRPIIIANRMDDTFNGCEIIAINDIPISDIMNTMIKYIYNGGNDISARASLFSYNDYLQYFALMNDTYPDQLIYKLINKEGESIKVAIDTNMTFSKDYIFSNDINFGVSTNELPSYAIRGNVGYIRIDTFNGRPKDIIDSFDSIVKEFKAAGVEGVVLDVRYNGGGNESFRNILGYLTVDEIDIESYRYKKSERYKDIYYLRPIWDMISSKSSKLPTEEGFTKWRTWRVIPAKEQFLTTIPITLLCNESIFSSTGDFVFACMDHKLATVIGNMVPLSGFGLSTPVLLPSGNYKLSYCFFESKSPSGAPLENVIMEPDLKIEQKYSDYLNGIDTQLEGAYQFIEDKIKE